MKCELNLSQSQNRKLGHGRGGRTCELNLSQNQNQFNKQFMIIESHCRYLTEFYFTDSTRYGIIFFKIMNLIE